MLKESFIVQKRLELRDWDVKDVMETAHKLKGALDCFHENHLDDAAKDAARFLDPLTDELDARCKDSSIWDYFFEEGKEPSYEG